MALHSSIVAVSPMSRTQIEDLFHHCRKAVAELPGAGRRFRRDLRWRHGPHWKNGNNEFDVTPGQAPIHLSVLYGSPGPLVDLDAETPFPAGTVAAVHLDSAGRESDPQNHTALIRTAVIWLATHHIAHQWRYEDHPWRTGLGDLNRIPAA